MQYINLYVNIIINYIYVFINFIYFCFGNRRILLDMYSIMDARFVFDFPITIGKNGYL